MGYVLRRRGKWCQSTSFSARDVDRLTAEERDCTTPVCRADKLRDATSCRGTARRHVDRSTCGRFESTSGGRGPEVPRSLRHRAPDTGEPTPNTLSVACRRDRALRHAAVSSYRLSCLCTCRVGVQVMITGIYMACIRPATYRQRYKSPLSKTVNQQQATATPRD